MKKAFKSVYIKKNTMSDADNVLLWKDIELYNRMMHTAFSWINHEKVFDDGRSLHLHLKDKFDCNDYFANSANRQAAAMISSQKALKEFYLTDMQDDISSIKRKIKKKEKRLSSLQKVLDSIITYTKKGWTNPAKLKTCQNVTFLDDGRVCVQYFKKKKYYPNLYLFEILWLKPKIKQIPNNIKQMEHKIRRLEKKITAMQDDKLVHVCFGTKKLYHDTRITGNDRVNALYKRRYAKLMVSGRADSKNGNWVFAYNTVTHDLSYRSMTDWNRHHVVFHDVEFPYGQDNIDDFIRSRRGAVAWEIRDCGNAWQITCVISEEDDPHKNNCFDEGCVSFDMNYDNISMSELDRSGNLVHHEVIRLYPEGHSSGHITQQISHALEHIFQYARTVHKPIVCENIESIQRKKFYDKNTKRTRHISMFACNKMAMLTAAKSNKYGIAITTVFPAYTSKIGILKYKKRYGLTTHEAAAFVIGRRGMGFVDRLPDNWKQRLREDKRTLPRMKQWKVVYALLKKMKYRDLNDILYPKKIPDSILYAFEF